MFSQEAEMPQFHARQTTVLPETADLSSGLTYSQPPTTSVSLSTLSAFSISTIPLPLMTSITNSSSTTSHSPTMSDANTGSITQSSTIPTHGANSSKSKSSSLSSGGAAGVAIAALLIGILLASFVLLVLPKRRPIRQRFHESLALSAVSGPKPEARSFHKAVHTVSQNDSVDMDRVLPQPLDDATIKHEVKILFTQIDGHVENFYTDGRASRDTPTIEESTTSDLLLSPRTRLFAIKRLICSAMIEAVNPRCSSDLSLLPTGFEIMARQMRHLNLDDQGKFCTLCQTRF